MIYSPSGEVFSIGKIMKYIFNSKQMYQIEQTAMENMVFPLGFDERAALSVVSRYHQNLQDHPFVVLCGTGNNGADGSLS